MQSTLSHTFAQVPSADIQRSVFNRSHGCKTTFDSGYLVPIFLDEALPGDTFNLRMSAFARLATPLKPVMDNMFLDSFFFAVPYRLVWDNWQRFNGEQLNPGDSTDYVVPQMVSDAVSGHLNGSLSDYFGIPTDVPSLSHSSLFHRAYNLIYNDWFRDENLQESVVVDTDDGPDSPADYILLRRGKRHDYFTSCLPWTQKGPSVDIPLGSTAPIHGTGGQTSVYNGADPTLSGLRLTTAKNVESLTAPLGTGYLMFGSTVGLETDLSLATASTINQLREAFQIQRLYERDARGGTRYIEIIRSHFGVVSPDARLQRPEYLGGGSTTINISPIAQTSSTDATTPQGNLAAMATAGISGHGFVKSFTEHCLILGFVNVRADMTYQQGLNRMFSRSTRFDFYWPALAHLGEQSVLNKEIYAQGTAADDDVFGYQERYAEYRYKPSIVTGQFRSNYAQSLDVWHLGLDFGSLPALNASFITENPPIDRIIATPSEPQVLLDTYFDFKSVRPMPTYSVPGMIDHF